jgi:hypothetical protein
MEGKPRITLTREDERKKEMRDDQLVGNNEGGYGRERRAILEGEWSKINRYKISKRSNADANKRSRITRRGTMTSQDNSPLSLSAAFESTQEHFICSTCRHWKQWGFAALISRHKGAKAWHRLHMILGCLLQCLVLWSDMTALHGVVHYQ